GGAVLLVLRHLQNRVDRFLLRLVDERAGVDDQDVGLRRILRQLVPRLFRETKHHLGVDEVLRTAEGNKAQFHMLNNSPPRVEMLCLTDTTYTACADTEDRKSTRLNSSH